MSFKTTDELDEHTKALGYCAVQKRTGMYMNVPPTISNREHFEKFIRVFRGTFYIVDIIK